MNESNGLETAVARSVEAIEKADAPLVTSGAGLGDDLSLADLWQMAGFREAFSALGRDEINICDIAPPSLFERPRLAWVFNGHRLNRYRVP